MTARQQRAPRAAGLVKAVESVLVLSKAALSSRRICVNAGLPADQAPHISSALAELRKRGLAEVKFGSDPDFPKTDRLYTATPKLIETYAALLTDREVQ
jgi:hypothetical protein